VATLAIAVGLSSGCWLTRSFDDLSTSASTGPDAGGSVATPTPTCAGTILCDDFEHDGGFDLTVWPHPENDQRQGSSLTIDSSHSHSGTWSLHAAVPRSDGGPAEDYLVRHFDTPLPSAFWGRLWILVPSTHPAEPWRPGIIGFEDASGKLLGLTVQKGALQAFESFDSPSIGVSATTLLLVNAFACIRWHVLPNRFEVFVGETSVLNLQPTSSSFPALTEVYLGMRLDPSPTDRNSDVWEDDFALSTSELTCD
jgi:hypothetical protein